MALLGVVFALMINDEDAASTMTGDKRSAPEREPALND